MEKRKKPEKIRETDPRKKETSLRRRTDPRETKMMRPEREARKARDPERDPTTTKKILAETSLPETQGAPTPTQLRTPLTPEEEAPPTTLQREPTPRIPRTRRTARRRDPSSTTSSRA
jgi:hypothetical protein